MPSWRVVAAGAVLAVLVQLYGLYRVTGPPTPTWFPDADKVGHALGFALPVFLILLARGLRRPAEQAPGARRTAVLVVAGVFLVHAVVSEVVQHRFYRARTGDPWDVVADSSGIVLGIAGFLLVSRSRPGDRTPTW